MVLVVGVESLSLGYSLDRYNESTGLYYKNEGVATLYNAEWKALVETDAKALHNNTANLRLYIDCQAGTIANWTACAHLGKDAQEKLTRLLKEITRQEQGTRRQRGVFNFIGELSKILFVTMDEDDTKYYNEKIKLFEQNSEDMMALLKQLNATKSSLGAVNNTSTVVEFNEKSIREGILKVKDYTQTLEAEPRMRGSNRRLYLES
jgi:hypothetical protein